MSLELQYFVCCKAGFAFNELEFRYMPGRRRREYIRIAQEFHKANKEEADKIKR